MSQSEVYSVIQHTMLKSASILILCALLTGLYMSLVAMKISPADFSTVLSSHLNALLGSFWIVSVAYSLKFCQLSAQKLSLLSRTIIVANFSNWFITLIKAHLHVQGIQLTQQTSNNIILVLLSLFVVIPALIASIIWIQGLFTNTNKTAQ